MTRGSSWSRKKILNNRSKILPWKRELVRDRSTERKSIRCFENKHILQWLWEHRDILEEGDFIWCERFIEKGIDPAQYNYFQKMKEMYKVPV